MKPSVRYFLFFCFLVINFFSNRDLFSEVFWNLPLKEITTSGTDARITTDSTGKYVYVVFSSNKLMIKASSDFAQSFAPAIELGSSSNSLAQIITNSSGLYVYVIWIEDKKVFQSVSSDYGLSFIDPIELNSCDLGIINPQIICDISGQYVYSIWEDNYGKIQMRSSSNFGTRWSDTIELAPGHNPQIITNNTGKYVYTIWDDDDVRTRVSTDFGKSFAKAVVLDSKGENPKIVTSNDGKFVYAIWQDGFNNMQMRASEFGDKWYSPLQFSSDGSFSIQLATDSSGKYVYSTWTDGKIHLIISSDFGNGFTTLDLDEKGSYPCIATDSIGRCVYLLWLDTNFDIQFRISTDFGVNFSPKLKLNNLSESRFTIPDIVLNKDGEYFYILWNNLNSLSVKIVNGIDLLLSK